jgi:hypothetical protein
MRPRQINSFDYGHTTTQRESGTPVPIWPQSLLSLHLSTIWHMHEHMRQDVIEDGMHGAHASRSPGLSNTGQRGAQEGSSTHSCFQMRWRPRPMWVTTSPPSQSGSQPLAMSPPATMTKACREMSRQHVTSSVEMFSAISLCSFWNTALWHQQGGCLSLANAKNKNSIFWSYWLLWDKPQMNWIWYLTD